MVNYSKLGFNSTEEYLEKFFSTLLESNRTYEYFVDWDKIKNNLQGSLVEIGILNSLSKVPFEELENKFREIIINYPNVVPILPLITAIREKKVDVFYLEDIECRNFNFLKTKYVVEDVMEFSKKSGLLNLFTEVDDLYSYLFGVEVGLDSNSRKNRSGKIFEGMVGDLLENNFKNVYDVRVEKEDSSVGIDRIKRFDYVVYVNNAPKYAIECNFYSSTGSKPIEVAHAYANLQKDLDEHGIKFIWVTDGQGWIKMSKTIENVIDDIEYLVDYKMLIEYFDDIFDV